MDLINPNKKQQSPHHGLPRMYQKCMSNVSSKVHAVETLALNPGTLSNFHKDCLACIGNGFTGIHLALNKFIPSTIVKVNYYNSLISSHFKIYITL